MHYQPLRPQHKEIRLVHLLSGEFYEPIRCMPRTISLDDRVLRPRPEYGALPYEWGTPESRGYTIILNEEPFAVRENLWLALKELRAQHKADIQIL